MAQPKGKFFHIDFQGDVGQMLTAAAARLSNYRPMLDLIGRQVTGFSLRSFDTKASPETGEPWAPLKRRRPKGHNQDSTMILFDKGDLYRSIRYRVLGDRAVWIGFDPRYGIYHQSDQPRHSNLPRRQFIGAPPDELPTDVNKWVDQCFSPHSPSGDA